MHLAVCHFIPGAIAACHAAGYGTFIDFSTAFCGEVRIVQASCFKIGLESTNRTQESKQPGGSLERRDAQDSAEGNLRAQVTRGEGTARETPLQNFGPVPGDRISDFTPMEEHSIGIESAETLTFKIPCIGPASRQRESSLNQKFLNKTAGYLDCNCLSQCASPWQQGRAWCGPSPGSCQT